MSRPASLLLYILPVAAMAGLMGLFLHEFDRAPLLHEQQVASDRPAPRLDLPALSAAQPGLKTRDLQGRVTLVNFFASWCVPCRAENPVLFAVRQAGIRLAGIDYKDKPDAAMAFLAGAGNPYAAVAVDRSGRAGMSFGIDGVPESFLIDKRGVIRLHWAGPLTADVLRNQIVPLARKLDE